MDCMLTGMPKSTRLLKLASDKMYEKGMKKA